MFVHVSAWLRSNLSVGAVQRYRLASRERLLAPVVGALLALAGISSALAADVVSPADPDQASPTAAQTTAESAPPAGAAAVQEAPTTSLQEVIVTGTRFRTPNASSPAPITIIGGADLLHQGATKTEELLNRLPQVNVGLADATNGSGAFPLTGTATVDLRGIGSFRTLVLMNGRRVNPGDAINPSADMHTIPEILIKRVEVLTGGASAIYGSDAVSGVVNFVMDDHFIGSKVTVQGSGLYGNNDNSGLQSIMRANGVATSTGSALDGKTINLNAVYGTDFAGGAGHIEAYAGYRRNSGILGSRRDFSSCLLQGQTQGLPYSCLLDPTTPAGQFVPYDATGTTPGTPYTLGAGGTLRPFTPADAYNPALVETLQRPDTRYNAGAFGQFTFNEHAQAYLETQFTNDYTTLRLEPSGTTATGFSIVGTDPTSLASAAAGLNTFSIPCSNPLLSPSEVSAFCTQNGLGAADMATVGIGRRNVEQGFLEDAFAHTSYRMVLGLKGEISEGWSYDGSVNYGKVTAHERLSNDVSSVRLARALNVVSVNGTPTCQSVVDGSDPSCLPYNIWSPGGVTPAAARYISGSASQDGYASHTVVSAQAVGDLGRYGLKSPAASDGVGLAVGTEYRDEIVNSRPGGGYVTGDLVSSGSKKLTLGTFHVAEGFAELKVPLLKDLPFAQSLNVDIADRFAQYTPQGSVNSYNFGADWAPLQTVRFRGSYTRAIRAPNGHELFWSQEINPQPISDPCSGPTPAGSQAQCALTGVTAAQYGNIPLTNVTNVAIGGNPKLRPEIANTLTAGIVFTNFDWAPGALVSVDYWRIRIKNYLGALGNPLGACLAGSEIGCANVVRGAGGSLAPGSGGFVNLGNTNTGGFGVSGVDVAGQYILQLHSAGSVTFTLNASKALDNPISVDPSAPSYDCIGLYGVTCTANGPTSPVPKWRHTLRTTWSQKNLEVSLNWRYIGALNFESTDPGVPVAPNEVIYPADSHVPAYNYFDLDLGHESANVDVRVGVNNLFDKKPPLVGLSSSPAIVNGNLLAGIFDPFGREIFVEVTAHF